MTNTNIEKVLKDTRRIVKHHTEISKVKGEQFNIYKILNLKTKEVRTHSAFIAELLNPSGSHFMGDAFLKAFINFLPNEVFKNHLDVNTTKTEVEYAIAKIDSNNKTGGRIDILLTDGNGKTISIENKIDAEDQKHQVERYCNYNESKNKVVYLSKFGDEPDDKSKGDLISGSDFYIISYQNQIIEWLEQCQKIASDQPILRESIKQYKILIQKITNVLGNQQEKELKKVVVNNLEEAYLISQKYNQVTKQLKKDFRDKVAELLKDKTNNFEIEKKKGITNKYASIWFNHKISDEKKIWIAAESFSGLGHDGGDLFVGIFSKNKHLKLNKDFDSLNKNWVHHKKLKHEGKSINLSENAFLQKISDEETLNSIAEDVSQQILSFLNDYQDIVLAESV